MKFFVNAIPREVQLTPEQGVAIYEASRQWMEANLATGVVECHYVFPQGGGFAIVNADSHEELGDHLLSFPMYGILGWEIRPLCDWNAMYGKWIEMFQNMAE